MEVTVKGRKLKLNKHEVKSAKKLVGDFMKKVQDSSKASSQPTYYFVVLLMMHIMSQDALDNIDITSLEKIMNTFYDLKRDIS